jgi:hypothetical protein
MERGISRRIVSLVFFRVLLGFQDLKGTWEDLDLWEEK